MNNIIIPFYAVNLFKAAFVNNEVPDRVPAPFHKCLSC